MHTFINDNSDKNIIIGGDFITVINPILDKKNGNLYTHLKNRTLLNDIIENCNLLDIWRTLNPSECKFTWHSNSKQTIYCRLDYFLISESLCNVIDNCCIKPGFMTDHSLVALKLNNIQPERGPGYFKVTLLLKIKEQFIQLFVK